MSTIDEENLKLAVLLRAARNMLGLSLKEVGEQVGVTSAGAGKWENGISPIKATIFNQLDKFYRYHGIEMEINAQGDPVVKMNPKGLALLKVNPKKPLITDLPSIYFNEKTQDSTSAFVELAIQNYELTRLREKHPDLNERELEAALSAIVELKKEQWEESFPRLKAWLEHEDVDN